MIGYAGTGYKGMQMCVTFRPEHIYPFFPLHVEKNLFADEGIVPGARRLSKATCFMHSSKLAQYLKPTPTIPRSPLLSAVQEQIKVFTPQAT